jgi:cardiolipin synthase
MNRNPGYNASPRRRWWLAGLFLAVVLAGCRTAATPYSVETEGALSPRGLVLARQLLADTTLEVACCPLQSAWDNCWELKDHLAALTAGVVGKRLAMNLRHPPDQCVPAGEAAAEAGPESLHLATTFQPAQVDLLVEGDAALEALKGLIDSATHRIDVLMFYWENDALGAEVAARLAARAGPDLRVRVLVDGGGNLIFGKAKKPGRPPVNQVVADLARQPYVEVLRIRNPFARFDHRKLVLVDGRAAWSGGRNFTSNSFFKNHDLSYTLRGPLVAELQQLFDDYWTNQGGKPKLRHELHHGDRVCRRSLSDAPLTPVNAYGRVVVTEPGDHQLARALYKAVDGARHHVYVENVYFSDSRLVCKLAQARRRGVDVRAVLTFSTSESHVNGANRVVANRLLRAGVRVYVYPIMTHVKAAAVDGLWAYLGTGNFDALSLRHNHELGLTVAAGPLLAEVEERVFRADCRPDLELTQPVPLSLCDYWDELVASLAL